MVEHKYKLYDLISCEYTLCAVRHSIGRQTIKYEYEKACTPETVVGSSIYGAIISESFIIIMQRTN